MKINQLKAGAIISYLSMGIGYIVSIIYTPIMLRLLGQSEYGLYNLVGSVVSYLGLLSFGFGSAYMRFYSRYKVINDQDNIAKLNGMFFIVFSVISFISTIAGAALVFNIDYLLGENLTSNEISTAKVLVSIMVFNIVISFLTSIFNSYITANESYVFQKLIQMVKVLVSPFIMLPILLMGYRSIGMVVATTILSIIVEIFNGIYCFKKLNIKFSFHKFDFSLMKEMTVFSSFIAMNMIIDQINWNVDKFILGRIKGTVAVAVYGIAAQLNTYYLSLSTSISNVFIPRVNRMIATDPNDNKELTTLFIKVGRVQFMVLSLIVSGLIFFGQPFINMWAGKEYSDAYYIVLLLIVPVTIPLIQNLGIEIQRAKNMHKFRSWVYLFIAILNVILSIPLSKLYGGIGSALGTAVSLIIGNGLIMNWYYHYRVGLNMKSFWAQIVRLAMSLIPPLISGFIIFLFIDLYNISLFLLYGSVYVIIFIASVWFLGMNKYEKNLITYPVMKTLKKMRLVRE
ncbi:oligosaccharide flippase family protein [Paenibacillus sp.]|uniref:oligosaccharide flippase family protein n=1 Tax=Paenibacillus sp. TaxID=58172 RepID=UPI0028AC1466|nr:oligosaccharide flippase family protein [Paenibacillus sp.]